ncbi:hypothetical protein ACAG39_08305 [Caldicellulosiruptoraceae bacterium PP1]
MTVRIIDSSININQKRDLLNKIGVDKYAANYLISKMTYLYIYIENLKPAAANILKQTMLSVGSDAAVNRGCINCSVEKSDCLIFGSIKQIQDAIEKLKIQPFGLNKLALEIQKLLEEFKNDNFHSG